MNQAELLKRTKDALNLGDLGYAEQLGHKLVNDQPGNSGLRILLGNIYAREKKYNRAKKQYYKAIRLHPSNPKAFNNLGVIYKQSGEGEKAIKALNKALSLMPESADICYNLGNLYRETEQPQLALKFYNRAIQLNQDFVLPYNNMGIIYEQQGSHGKAKGIYSRGLSIDTNQPTLLYNLGIVLEEEGEPEAALKQYNHALKTRPNWVEGLNNRGVVLQKLHKEEEALKSFKTILKIDPQNQKANNNMGVVLSDLGREEEAEIFFQKALSRNPLYEKAAINLSHFYEKNGDFERAQKHLLTVLQKDPHNLEAKIHLAKTLIGLGKYTDAIRYLHEVLEMRPKELRVLTSLVEAYQKSGNSDKALEYSDLAKELDPRNSRILLQRAETLRTLGRFSEVVQELKTIIQRDPRAINERIILGEVYLQQNQHDEALALFKQLYMEHPDNEEILLGLIQAYRQVGAREEAIRVAEELVNLFGKHGKAKDLEHLNTSLQIYQQIVDDYAESFREMMKDNIQKLVNFAGEQSVAKGEQEETGSLLLEEIPELEGETVPIIDVGGIDPVIEINEEEESLTLTEMEEELDLPEQELKYLMEEVIPATQAANHLSPGPGPQQPGGDGGGSSQRLQDREGVGSQNQHPLTYTADSAAPDFHRSSVYKAGELSSVPHPPYPEESTTSEERSSVPSRGKNAAATAGSAPSAIPHTAPRDGGWDSNHAQPLAVSAIRNEKGGTAPLKSNRSANPIQSPGMDHSQFLSLSSVPPGALPVIIENLNVAPNQVSSTDPSIKRNRADTPAETEIKEELIIESLNNHRLIQQHSEPNGKDIDTENVTQNLDETQDPTPKEDQEPAVASGTDEDVEEITPNEEEKDIHTGNTGKEQAEQTEVFNRNEQEKKEEAILNPGSSTQERSQIKNATNENAKSPITQEELLKKTQESPAQLIHHLETLINYLPQEKQRNFRESEMFLKVEALRHKLLGKKGLIKTVESHYHPHISSGKTVLTTDKLGNAFGFFNQLATYYPQKDIALALKHKLSNILSHLRSDQKSGQ